MPFLNIDFLENFILHLVDGTPLCDTLDDTYMLIVAPVGKKLTSRRYLPVITDASLSVIVC